MNAQDVVITGIGLVSALGEGAAAHWKALNESPVAPILDSERFSPFSVHPLPALDWSRQIPKKGDQRQMETWQRLGVYAAGLALEDAGAKDDAALCASMDMIVAAAGGERDEAVDGEILRASQSRNDRALLLNEKLTTDLRPTLFLAQLSNLLAGNISIVHKVTGSSRTFMGEEGAGIAAVETAAARIRAGQSTHALVGAAFQTESFDMLVTYELGGLLHRGAWRPVWGRAGCAGGGVVTGSGAAFLVLESRGHASARGKAPYAALSAVRSGRVRRDREDLAAALGEMVAQAAPQAPALVVSGASGAHAATAAEGAALGRRPADAVRGFATRTGHLKEAQFPFALALAALAVSRRSAYPPFDTAEAPFGDEPTTVLATTVGYGQTEGLGVVTAA